LAVSPREQRNRTTTLDWSVMVPAICWHPRTCDQD